MNNTDCRLTTTFSNDPDSLFKHISTPRKKLNDLKAMINLLIRVIVRH